MTLTGFYAFLCLIKFHKSSRLNELGYRPDAIEAQLAHMNSNSVRRSYNHATYLEERKIMMQDWADKLDIWVKRTSLELKS